MHGALKAAAARLTLTQYAVQSALSCLLAPSLHRLLEDQQREVKAAVEKGTSAIAALHAARERLPEELQMGLNSSSASQPSPAAEAPAQKSDGTMKVCALCRGGC